MIKGNWHLAKMSIQMAMVGLIYVLMLGAVEAGEPFAVLELFTSQG